MTGNIYSKAIPLHELTIDPTVQRQEGVDQRQVDRRAKAFNPDALGTVIVSEREDGSLVCLDGAHRRAVCEQVGFLEPVDCKVFTELTKKEEAGLFLLYNDKKDPSAISRFNARVVSEEPVAVEIHRITTDLGWKIGLSGEPGWIAAVQKLEVVFRSAGRTKPDGAYPEILGLTLSILGEAWEYSQKAGDGMLLVAVGQLLGRFGPDIDTTRLVAKLQRNDPTHLIARARGLQAAQKGSVPAALAKLIVDEYNTRLGSNALPAWTWIR